MSVPDELKSSTCRVSASEIDFHDMLGFKKECLVFQRVVSYLQEFKKAREGITRTSRLVGKGAIIHGAPGTGKSRLADCLAGHAGVKSVRMPSPSSSYMGGMEKILDKLFEEAESHRPCVLIIDEADSFLSLRFHDTNSSNRSVEYVYNSAVNRFLCLVDRLPEGIFIMATTNMGKKLDAAVTRPGRLDLFVELDKPSPKGAVQIFKHYVSRNNCFICSSIEASFLISLVSGLTAAELEKFARHVCEIVVDNDEKTVTERHLLYATGHVQKHGIDGDGYHSCQEPTEEELLFQSLHETAHVVVAHKLGWSVLCTYIGMPHGGATRYSKHKTGEGIRRSYLEEKIVILLAGMAVEKMKKIDRAFTCMSDLQIAKETAELLIKNGHGHKLFYRLGLYDNEVDRILVDGIQKASQIVAENETLLLHIAPYLQKSRILLRKQLNELLVLKNITVEPWKQLSSSRSPSAKMPSSSLRTWKTFEIDDDGDDDDERDKKNDDQVSNDNYDDKKELSIQSIQRFPPPTSWQDRLTCITFPGQTTFDAVKVFVTGKTTFDNAVRAFVTEKSKNVRAVKGTPRKHQLLLRDVMFGPANKNNRNASRRGRKLYLH